MSQGEGTSNQAVISDLSLLVDQIAPPTATKLKSITDLLDSLAVILRQGKTMSAGSPADEIEDDRETIGVTELPELLSSLLKCAQSHLCTSILGEDIDSWRQLTAQVGRVAANLVADDGENPGELP